jgi:hypothetical protein
VGDAAGAVPSVPGVAPSGAAPSVPGGGVSGDVVAAGVGDGAASLPTVCKIECVPVTAGNESINATSIKIAAAAIVSFASTLAVPRGPNAVLDNPLENNAPALDLPGCKRITVISTRQEKMNTPYSM